MKSSQSNYQEKQLAEVIHMPSTAMRPPPHRLDRLHRDRGYRWADRDPEMEWICDAIEKSGLSIGEIQERILDLSNNGIWVAYGTIQKWLDGTTRRPQNFTLTWVAFALGYSREWIAIKVPKGRQ